VQAFADGDPAATERVRTHWHKDTFTLNDAHFVLAREYGFDSWPKLVARLIAAGGISSRRTPPYSQSILDKQLSHATSLPLRSHSGAVTQVSYGDTC
jgi:hypothetical protein